LAQTETGLRRSRGAALAPQPLPAYLGVAVDIAGKHLVTPQRRARGATTLAAATSRTSAVGPIHVAVVLTDPDAFYARERTRTLWFGSLIGASVVAVLIGFVTAWRAFRRQQRLSELKTNFVSSVSHELRAPIASVRLMAEELEDVGPHDRAKTKEYHRFIVQECRRLSGLIENVLDFARHEQGRKQYEFEPTDLVALVRETARLMQTYAADRQVLIATQIGGDPAAVEVDGRAIQQVLVNLVDNAIKYSPTGAAVTVGLEFPPRSTLRGPEAKAQPPRPDIAGPEDGLQKPPRSTVCLFVEDQGPGIPAEDHDKVFERFYRRGSELQRETQGVGLGLAIVKYVAEAHGGKVTVRSAVGQGSRFTVQLPLGGAKS
jgi:signal transduction histidine kinase